MVNNIGNIILFTLTVGTVLCVLVYRKAPWYQSDIGQQSMSFMASLGLLVFVLSVRNIFGEYPGYDIIRVITYAILGITVWWRLFLLLKYAEQDKETNYGRRDD